MRLRSLLVENFRGIRRGSLSFDETTFLIGENDCGKSSLLEAIESTLAGGREPPRFTPAHFHHEPGAAAPAGPLRIELRFREREAGEWSEAGHEPLTPLLTGATRRAREVALEVTAAETGSGEAGSSWRLRNPETGRVGTDPELLAWIRRRHPVLRMRNGLWGDRRPAPGEPPPPTARNARLAPDLADLIGDIEASAWALLSEHSRDPSRDLEVGFRSARELIARSSHHLLPEAVGLGGSIEEILGHDRSPARRGRVPARRESGSTVEKAGMLFVVAAVARALPEGLAPGADPVWILEDPEAHLHPMTLASVSLLLRRIGWQKIVTTHSGDLLGAAPLRRIRRLVRHEGIVRVYAVGDRSMSREDLRRLGYHLRAHHGGAVLARLWLLVEGESEYWILPQLARLLGYEFSLEGIQCVTYSQCGPEPLLKAARELGIEWHLLADGDRAGAHYGAVARRFVSEEAATDRVTVLQEPDIEHCFWRHGYAETYRSHAGAAAGGTRRPPPGRVIEKAIRNRSKPYLALQVVEAVAAPGSPGVPGPLRSLLEGCIRQAREAPARNT